MKRSRVLLTTPLVLGILLSSALVSADPNTIDASANDLTRLRNQDFMAIEAHRLGKGDFKRGDVILVFPGKKGSIVVGEQAEKWIKEGGPLQGLAYGGMPVSEYGSVAWARQNLKATGDHALAKAKKNSLFKSAVKAVAKGKPELQKAARAMDLQNPKLHKALEAHAKSNTRFNGAWTALQGQLTSPMIAVVNGFGVPNAGDGQKHFHEGIRPQNERGKPGPDVSDAKVAGLLFARFQHLASKMNLSGAKISSGKLAAMLRSPELRTLVGATLVGHCAGGANSANTAMHLEALVNKNAKTFPIGKAFLKAVRVIGHGAAFNVPKSIGGGVFFVGRDDQFGRLNSPSMAIAKNSRTVIANHMMNPANRDEMKKLDNLPTRPINEVFKLRLFADGKAAPKTLDARLAKRQKSLETAAQRYVEDAAAQKQMLRGFSNNESLWSGMMLTSNVLKKTLEGHGKIATARGARASALAKFVAAKRLEKQADGIAARDPQRAAKMRRDAKSQKAKALRAVKSAKRDERWAKSSLKSGVRWLESMYNWHGMAAAGEYQYIHKYASKVLAQKLGKKEVEARGKKSQRVGKVIQYQLAKTTFKAHMARTRLMWPHLDANQRREMLTNMRNFGKQLHQMRRAIGPRRRK